MKKFLLLLLVLAVSLVGRWQAEALQTDNFKLIVHADNPNSSIDKDQASSYLLKKKSRWENWDSGAKVDPVDLNGNSPTRAAMSEAIHGRSVASIKNYWQRQIFSGRSTPPPELSNDQAVVDFVKSKPGAIGYVSSSARLDGVKELQVTGD